MKEKIGADITMEDIVKYYDNVLKNGVGFTESTRQYVTELRDAAANGVLLVASQDRQS